MAKQTLDHKPDVDKEKERILAAKSQVFMRRVNGTLAVSRAFGDFEYKEIYIAQGEEERKKEEEKVKTETPLERNSRFAVSAVPDVEIRKLDGNEFVVTVACDGVWDMLNNEEAIQYLQYQFKCGKKLQNIANELLDTSIAKGSRDNLTAIVACFNPSGRHDGELMNKDKTLDEKVKERAKKVLSTVKDAKSSFPTADFLMRNFLGIEEELAKEMELPPGAGISAK